MRQFPNVFSFYLLVFYSTILASIYCLIFYLISYIKFDIQCFIPTLIASGPSCVGHSLVILFCSSLISGLGWLLLDYLDHSVSWTQISVEFVLTFLIIVSEMV